MSAAMIRAKMTVETPDGLIYEFPNVELLVTANVEPGEMYGDPRYFYEQSPSYVSSVTISGHAFKGKDEDYIYTARMKQKRKGKLKKNGN